MVQAQSAHATVVAWWADRRVARAGRVAAYDALVKRSAAEHRAVPATRDVRASGTYEKIGIRTVIAA
jgi:hypothetical protein